MRTNLQPASSVSPYLQGDYPVVVPPEVLERLLQTVRNRLPRKSFGYLISHGDPRRADDFILFESNTRNSGEWKPKFEAYGQYFLDHDDAGFVSTPEESFKMHKKIMALDMIEVALFHSHLRHPGNFSGIDFDMHTQCHGHLWHMILSMRNPHLPQVRVFDVAETGVREQRLLPDVYACNASGPTTDAIARARDILTLNPSGRPTCKDNRLIVEAVNGLLQSNDRQAIRSILIEGFLAGSAQRFSRWIAPMMHSLFGGLFAMGTPYSDCRHFVGESPRHTVELSSFRLATVPVTNELYALFNPRHTPPSAGEALKPAVNITWFDATVFAMWMGCRLPTEAEWEFACSANTPGEWATSDEKTLHRLAWFSENAAGEVRPVATRDPNAFGLYDLHGNVWEWCRDTFDQDFYAASPFTDPIRFGAASANKVCRGGSVHALAEMCRSSYRFHEPPGFYAADLGFRLAASGTTGSNLPAGLSA